MPYQTPFGLFFDRDAWAWKDTGMSRATGSQPDDGLRMLTSHFTEFAIRSVVEDCQGVPLSLKVKDACGECGGTNQTCSGCDGVANTGRTKQCSDHGSCNLRTNTGDQLQTTCQCEPGWYAPSLPKPFDLNQEHRILDREPHTLNANSLGH